MTTTAFSDERFVTSCFPSNAIKLFHLSSKYSCSYLLCLNSK